MAQRGNDGVKGSLGVTYSIGRLRISYIRPAETPSGVQRGRGGGGVVGVLTRWARKGVRAIRGSQGSHQ